MEVAKGGQSGIKVIQMTGCISKSIQDLATMALEVSRSMRQVKVGKVGLGLREAQEQSRVKIIRVRIRVIMKTKSIVLYKNLLH